MGMGSSTFELQTADGAPIRGDVRWPDVPGPRPAVVVCHGFKGFKDWGFFPWLGERLADAGFVAVRFNFSGSGIGSDPLEFTELDRFAADTVSQQVDDLGTVLDALSAGRLAPGGATSGPIAVLGHSRGGGVAILRAREDARIDAVVTWAGVATFQRWSQDERCAWRAQGRAEFPNTRTGQIMRVDATFLDDLERNAGRLDVLRAAAELEVPLLVVHGGSDTSVPPSEATALVGAAARAEHLLV